MFKKYMEKKFSKRETSEFNTFRTIFQWITCHWFIGTYVKLFYKMEVHGTEKLETDKKYLIAANHMTGLDPFVIAYALNKTMAFMAKEELFATFWSRVLMDFCGAFSVNREKLEVSTIKTAIAVNKSNWILGIFPQGTRDKSGMIHHVSRGFTALAKTSKCDIMPVSIVGMQEGPKGFRKGKLIVKVGELIPYGETEETIQKWCAEMSRLSGLEYQPEG